MGASKSSSGQFDYCETSDKKNELGYRAKAINLQNQLLVSDRNQLSFFLEDIDNQNLNQIRSSVEKTSQGQDL